jgi:CxxC-x17-CxxC domain-containing protein
MLADQVLHCRDCGADFTWTVGEQEFYASRGLTNSPGRCPDCRSARKAMGGGRSGGGGGGGGHSGRRDHGPQREMHEVTCASCGALAQVPFVPRGDRPVYCRDCFSTAGR